MTKEDVYDEHINPLMAQILEICKAHKIAMMASFSIPNEEDPDLHCSSRNFDNESEPSLALKQAWEGLMREPKMFAFTVTTKEARGV